MRFSLVDKITELESGQSITAVKNLSLAEEYLADHFPGFPVMPGVLMVEALVQTGAWLMRYTEDFKYSTILLKRARAVRFNNFVSPGKTLIVSAKLHTRDDGIAVIKGSGTVDGGSAVNAKIDLEIFNLADREPRLAESDQRQIDILKQQFAELWRPNKA